MVTRIVLAALGVVGVGAVGAHVAGWKAPEALLEEAMQKMLLTMKKKAPSNGWACHRYEDDQGDDWCKVAGVTDGWEYKFVGYDGPEAGLCEDCWCCKQKHKEVKAEPQCTALWDQCGGEDFAADTACCDEGAVCVSTNPDYQPYKQCRNDGQATDNEVLEGEAKADAKSKSEKKDKHSAKDAKAHHANKTGHSGAANHTKSTTKKSTTESTTKSTTESTTKATTESTTKSTTESTAKATPKSTTESTTKSTTEATTAATTEAPKAEHKKKESKDSKDSKEEAKQDVVSVQPWQCQKYQEGQDDEWCKGAGNQSGFQYRFEGGGSDLCGDCWCCKRALAPPKKCAKSGEDCRKSECCEQEGFQCYEQDSKWASCKSTCTEDDWTCKEFGERTPVSDMDEAGAAPGQICAIAGKCKQAGYQCYQMNDYYSACKVTCEAKDWTCKDYGNRTAMGPRTGGTQCAWGADLCSPSGCCVAEGLQCYSRDEYWSSCMAACNTTMKFGDNVETWSCDTHGNRTEVELGCTWGNEECTVTKNCCHPGFSCVMKEDERAYCTKETDKPGWEGKVIGGGHWEWEVQPAKPGENESGTSLFCFLAVLPGSAEEGLQWAAESKNASVFACDEHAVFNSWQSARGDDGGADVSEQWGSVINTDVFVNVWEQVLADGRYKKHDWTVKVDPDAVFFPDRLKYKLGNLHAPDGWPIYIKNTLKDFGFLGACEVLSVAAVNKYFRYYHECFATISAKSGEDGYIKGCMDMVGAGYMLELDVLRTPWHPDACTDPGRVTFHPRKDPEQWDQCYNEALR